MKEKLTRRALELGFDACHFTSANPPDSADHFTRWLEQNRHGEMGYLARNANKRINPEAVLENAASIVTLAISYFPSKNNPVEATESGIVARYAQYSDYHDVLKPPLQKLSQYLVELGGADAKALWYLDTGPILERDIGQRSGLGFVGKHTNLISRQLGNWFFIAEIITTVKFPADPPEKNRCGTCNRCIEVCPTQAITGPFQLDARKCVSYLTIELKGSIPESLRPLIGNRVYGCDDCLAACPWNRFAKAGSLMNEHRREDLDQLNLVELLGLDDEAFRVRFKGTPMKRTKRRGILRNACVALGNIGDRSAIPALKQALSDHEPLIVEHAAWAITRIVERLGDRN